MNLNKFTEKAQEAVLSAQRQTEGYSHSEIRPSFHLLLALLRQEGGLVPQIVRYLSLNPETLAKSLETQLHSTAKIYGGSLPYLSRALISVLNETEKIAAEMGDDYVSTEHLLLGLTDSSDNAAALLQDSSITREAVLQAMTYIRGSQRPVTNQDLESTYKVLQQYGRDLTDLARRYRLDPVIRRDEEIRLMIQTLSRRTRNNPILVGEPGIGKSTIVEGLAQRIVQGDVPGSLRDKKLFALDVGSLIAGEKYQGELEECIRSIFAEIVYNDDQVILFIDELHTVMGTAVLESLVNVANMFKSTLADDNLQLIGTTTLDKYRKHIEKDPVLQRHFQPILIKELNIEDTISILRVLKERYEVHHGVRIQDSAVIAAATLSDQYIKDRFLPNKAIDLIDEAASYLRTEMDTKPFELEKIDRAIMQMEAERGVLKKEKDKASKERLSKLESDISAWRQKSQTLTTRWQNEINALQAISEIKMQIYEIQSEVEQAERRRVFKSAARLRSSTLPQLKAKLAKQKAQLTELQAELAKQEAHLAKLQAEGMLIKEEVDAEVVAQVVSRWIGTVPGESFGTIRHYHSENIRLFLNDGFNDEELRRFCFDNPGFRWVYDQLAQDTGKAKIIDQLLDYAERKSLLEILLAWAREQNPAKYSEYQPYY